MTIKSCFELLCGIGLFLFGIHIMGEGLQKAAGEKLKSLLSALTQNRFMSVLVGFIVTAIIQSSTATTVMAVGFVNVGLMTLRQSVGVIMGANIGTTVTSVLIAIDFSQIAPLAVFLGAMTVMFVKNEKIKTAAEIVTGFGLLFFGMNVMSVSMEPLRDFQPLQHFLTHNNNALSGIIIGTVMTALIQSSSASVGVLQTLALKGLIPLRFAIYVLYGQNIGTVFTAMLSAIGANANAKRAGMIHLLFNVVGTILFMPLMVAIPFESMIEKISSNPSAQISAVHIIFNVASTVIMFPFAKQLEQAAVILVPDKKK